MKLLLKSALLCLALPVSAEVITLAPHLNEASKVNVTNIKTSRSHIQEIEFKLKQVQAFPHKTHPQYTVLSEKGISFSQNVGEASLPYKAIVVAGRPENIQVTLDRGTSVEVALTPVPAQPEDCRCSKANKNKFVSLSQQAAGSYKVEYLGTYRGQDLSRVTIMAAEVLPSMNVTKFYPELRAQIVSQKSLEDMYSKNSDSHFEYLIVSPEALLPGIENFVQYKSSHGFNIKVVKLEDIGKDVQKLTAYFKSEYEQNNYKYVLIVGDENQFPTHKVDTVGSSRTPSDYTYFLMDSNDIIPDVQYGRVVASTVEEVSRQTERWIDYQERTSPLDQYLHMIGIASNEGDAPSDNDYITGIENDMKAAFGTTASHFYENNANSTPQYVNEALNKGAAFFVYMGHGSGTSWSSTGQTYTVEDVKRIENADVLKPILIDVACQNGILKKGYLGETFVNSTDSQGRNVGASMYYGGSVNISWHPPAIMARGMVKKTIEQNLNIIGDVLLAGHIYLFENFTSLESVRDNFEWYHLFGEPSSPVYLK